MNQLEFLNQKYNDKFSAYVRLVRGIHASKNIFIFLAIISVVLGGFSSVILYLNNISYSLANYHPEILMYAAILCGVCFVMSLLHLILLSQVSKYIDNNIYNSIKGLALITATPDNDQLMNLFDQASANMQLINGQQNKYKILFFLSNMLCTITILTAFASVVLFVVAQYVNIESLITRFA